MLTWKLSICHKDLKNTNRDTRRKLL